MIIAKIGEIKQTKALYCYIPQDKAQEANIKKGDYISIKKVEE